MQRVPPNFQPYRSARYRPGPRNIGFGPGQLLQDDLCCVQQDFAQRGEIEPPCAAVEDLCVREPLDLPQAIAQRGLAEAKRLCRAGQGDFFFQCRQRAQVFHCQSV